MTRFIAFLRAVNVGGRVVKMEELRAHLATLGLAKVETFIASGNAIFETTAKSSAALQAKIEESLRELLGYEVKTFLRTDAEVATVAQCQPFPPARRKSARVLYVGMLDAPLPADVARKLLAYRSGVDDFRAVGREIYWLCQVGGSESPFFKVPIERVLGVRLTFRNMNTIQKLAAKYPPARAARQATR